MPAAGVGAAAAFRRVWVVEVFRAFRGGLLCVGAVTVTRCRAVSRPRHRLRHRHRHRANWNPPGIRLDSVRNPFGIRTDVLRLYLRLCPVVASERAFAAARRAEFRVRPTCDISVTTTVTSGLSSRDRSVPALLLLAFAVGTPFGSDAGFRQVPFRIFVEPVAALDSPPQPSPHQLVRYRRVVPEGVCEHVVCDQAVGGLGRRERAGAHPERERSIGHAGGLRVVVEVRVDLEPDRQRRSLYRC